MDIAILNIYAQKKMALKFIKETLLQLKVYNDPHIVMIDDFNIPILPIDSSTRQKLNREKLKLDSVINQMALTDTYR